MELQWGWPALTCILMFGSFWVGKVTSFADGFDEGRFEGVQQGSKVVTKVVIEFMRDEYELTISDYEIKEIVDGLTVKWEEDDK